MEPFSSKWNLKAHQVSFPFTHSFQVLMEPFSSKWSSFLLFTHLANICKNLYLKLGSLIQLLKIGIPKIKEETTIHHFVFISKLNAIFIFLYYFSSLCSGASYKVSFTAFLLSQMAGKNDIIVKLNVQVLDWIQNEQSILSVDFFIYFYSYLILKLSFILHWDHAVCTLLMVVFHLLLQLQTIRFDCIENFNDFFTALNFGCNIFLSKKNLV